MGMKSRVTASLKNKPKYGSVKISEEQPDDKELKKESTE